VADLVSADLLAADLLLAYLLTVDLLSADLLAANFLLVHLHFSCVVVFIRTSNIKHQTSNISSKSSVLLWATFLRESMVVGL
jgi:uncharacterized protein YjbI with pentapeptide repeats